MLVRSRFLSFKHDSLKIGFGSFGTTKIGLINLKKNFNISFSLIYIL